MCWPACIRFFTFTNFPDTVRGSKILGQKPDKDGAALFNLSIESFSQSEETCPKAPYISSLTPWL